MRAIPLLVASMVLFLPTAGADTIDLQAPNEVFLYRMADGDVLLAWNPALGATHYVVYRGTEPGALTPIYEGEAPMTLDSSGAAPGTTILYVISAIDGEGRAHSTTVQSRSSGGDCVALNSSLSFSVSVANCLSAVPEL